MTTPMTNPLTATFADLGVPDALVAALTADGLTDAFPIQVQTLPDTLAGRDVLGRGKTGSGKTLAFSIPLVSRLAGSKRQPGRPAGLVLAPTRELATQITATLTPLAAAYGLQGHHDLRRRAAGPSGHRVAGRGRHRRRLPGPPRGPDAPAHDHPRRASRSP